MELLASLLFDRASIVSASVHMICGIGTPVHFNAALNKTYRN